MVLGGTGAIQGWRRHYDHRTGLEKFSRVIRNVGLQLEFVKYLGDCNMLIGSLATAPRNKTRSVGIDSLRATLALWVVASHAIYWNPRGTINDLVLGILTKFEWWLRQGQSVAFETHPAVLGFIVLSGYCVHRNGLRTTDVSAHTYAVRRAFRIIPVYLFACIVGWAAVLVLNQAGHRWYGMATGSYGLDYGCLAKKVLLISALIPSEHKCAFQGNAPLVTVMVEMWLYAIYPFVILGILSRWREYAIWAALLSIWIGGLMFVNAERGLQEWWNNGSLIGFLIYWWIGAKFVSPEFKILVTRAVLPIAVVWIGIAAVITLGKFTAPILIEIKKIAFALLFGLLLAKLDRSAARYHGFIAPIGRAGYSVYALHAPLLLTLFLVPVSWHAAVAAAIIFGVACYHVYERPLNLLGQRLASRWATEQRAMP